MTGMPDPGILARFHTRAPRTGDIRLEVIQSDGKWMASVSSPLRAGYEPLVFENVPLALAIRVAAEVARRCDRDVAMTDPTGLCDVRVLAALLARGEG